jgi:hypothetical protein
VVKAAEDRASDHAVAFGKLVASWPGDISGPERILWNAWAEGQVAPAAVVVIHPLSEDAS